MTQMIRIGKCFLMHLVFGGISSGVILWLVSGYESSSELLRKQFADSPDGGDSVLAVIQDAQSALLFWALMSILVSMFAAIVFVATSEMSQPRGYEETGTKAGRWWVLFMFTFFMVCITWWGSASLEAVGWILQVNNYWISCITVLIGNLLAFFLSTALFVKQSMVRSVPGAEAVRPLGWR
jgi:hypothetical protein